MGKQEDLRTLIHWIRDAGKSFEKTNDIQVAVYNMALDADWYGKKEFPAPYKAPQRMRKGRIDLLLGNDGTEYAIEIDDVSVKAKSIAKLLTLSKVRIAVVARGQLPQKINGIDVVITCADVDPYYRIDNLELKEW